MPFVHDDKGNPKLQKKEAAEPPRGASADARGYAAQAAALSPSHGNATGTGGQAVVQLQQDPNLDRNVTGTSGNYADPDRAADTLTGLLPYNGRNQWDGEQILKHWSQVDKMTYTQSDEYRCGANATMAPRILQGPLAVVNMGMEIWTAKNQERQDLIALGDAMTADMARQLEEPLAVLMYATTVFYNDMGTYSWLDLMADAIKKLMLGGATVASASIPIERTNQVGADMHSNRDTLNRGIPGRPQDVNTLCNGISAGEAWTVNVDTNPVSATQVTSEADCDHYITVGKDASGKVYLYDPAPRTGDQMIYKDTSPDAFMAYFRDATSGKMKCSVWLNRAKPKDYVDPTAATP